MIRAQASAGSLVRAVESAHHPDFRWKRKPLFAFWRLTRFLERADFLSNRHPAPAYRWSMIFSENRHALFGIML
jgi:hypothetical protein